MGDPSELMQKLDGVKSCAHWCVSKQPPSTVLHVGKCCSPSHPINGVLWLTTIISKAIFCLLIRAPFWEGEIQTDTESWICSVLCAQWLATEEPQIALCLSIKSRWILWYHQKTTVWSQNLNSTNSHIVLPQKGGWADRAQILQPLLRPQLSWKYCLNSPQHCHYEYFCPYHLCQNKHCFGLGGRGGLLSLFCGWGGEKKMQGKFLNSKKCE